MSDDDDGWYYGGADPEARDAARSVMQEAVRCSRLKPHEASALRRIMGAVNTFAALDDFVDALGLPPIPAGRLRNALSPSAEPQPSAAAASSSLEGQAAAQPEVTSHTEPRSAHLSVLN